MRKHRVKFMSPGTLFVEETTKPIDSWSTDKALAMATTIVERHGARPFAFQFETVIVAKPISDGEGGVLNVIPKQVAKSGVYYIGGDVLTLDDIPDTPKFSILRSNMRGNGWQRVVKTSRGGYQPLGDDDVVLVPR